MQEFSARVVETLAELKRMQLAVFGSDPDGFKLNDPILEHNVAEFERELSIQLPSECRLFVTEVGNGGAGPSFGVFPLGMMDDGFELRKRRANDGTVGDPSIPFELTDEWNDSAGMPSPDLVDRDRAEYTPLKSASLRWQICGEGEKDNCRSFDSAALRSR